MRRAVVVADPDEQDTGHVGARLARLGFVERVALRPQLPTRGHVDLDDADIVVLLGSADAVYDPGRAAVVEAESALVRRALGHGVPVLAICYGAQLAAYALGGSVRAAQRGEVGWLPVDSTDDELCGPGPWLQFHSDVLTCPPGARATGSSPCGPQGFVLDPQEGRAGLVAWQFHPEATPAAVARWVHQMWDYVLCHGGDPHALIAHTRAREVASRAAAARLVDAALAHLGIRT